MEYDMIELDTFKSFARLIDNDLDGVATLALAAG